MCYEWENDERSNPPLPLENFILCLTKKYAVFSGKSSAAEFWGFICSCFSAPCFSPSREPY